MEAAWNMVWEFTEPAACIIKHTNPCGAATAATLHDAYVTVEMDGQGKSMKAQIKNMLTKLMQNMLSYWVMMNWLVGKP